MAAGKAVGTRPGGMIVAYVCGRFGRCRRVCYAARPEAEEAVKVSTKEDKVFGHLPSYPVLHL